MVGNWMTAFQLDEHVAGTSLDQTHLDFECLVDPTIESATA